MVGVCIAPDEHNDNQVEEMRATTVAWTENDRTGAIDRQDAWLDLILTVIKKLEYLLLTLTLTNCN